MVASSGSNSAVLLRGFGAVTVGRTVAEALVRATALERQAGGRECCGEHRGRAIGVPGPRLPRRYSAHDMIFVGQIQRAWNY